MTLFFVPFFYSLSRLNVTFHRSNINLCASSQWNEWVSNFYCSCRVEYVFKHDSQDDFIFSLHNFPMYCNKAAQLTHIQQPARKKNTTPPWHLCIYTTIDWHYLVAQSKVQVHLLIKDVKMMHSDRITTWTKRKNEIKNDDEKNQMLNKFSGKSRIRAGIWWVSMKYFANHV